MRPVIKIKRAYEKPEPGDGFRVLVDRLYPRGLTRSQLRIDLWAKELAPSDALRRWFAHKPERWSGFVERYHQELQQPNKKALAEYLLAVAREKPVTLVYSAKDTEHNNAVVLQEFLLSQAKPSWKSSPKKSKS
jgi:uncharacterized protein YeaO (DUF488 family)